MAELWFYHLERRPLEEVLPRLIEASLAKGWRALVRGGLEERLDQLDLDLWLRPEEGFIPHAREGRGDPARNPVWLTTKPGNPNGAKALFLIDGAEPGDLTGFARACLIFDGRDETSLASARERWKLAKSQGVLASYHKEKPDGGWEKLS